MTLFLLSFIVIGIALLGMAAGVLLGRPAIKGSCGGLNKIGLNKDCACSSKEQQQCEQRSQNQR